LTVFLHSANDGLDPILYCVGERSFSGCTCTVPTVSVSNPVILSFSFGRRILESANLKYGPDPYPFVGNGNFFKQ
jgi:hypothetical protein